MRPGYPDYGLIGASWVAEEKQEKRIYVESWQDSTNYYF